MTARGVEKTPWVENTPDGNTKEPAQAQQQPPAKARLFSAATIKDFFGKVAEAVTGKPTPSLVKRRKRKEESKGAFSRALVLTARTVRRLFHQAANDDEQIQIETERLLRLEIDEYARQQDSFEDHSEADYQPVAALDLKM